MKRLPLVCVVALLAVPTATAASDELDESVGIGMMVLNMTIGTAGTLLLFWILSKGGVTAVLKHPVLKWRLWQYTRKTGRSVIVVNTIAEGGLFHRPMLDMDDALEVEQFLRENGDRPADLIITTYGGNLLAGLRLARLLRRYPNVRVVVPKFAFSAGTLVSTASDAILAHPDAMFGPVDPQFGGLLEGMHSAKDWLHVAARKGSEAKDSSLAHAEVGRRLMSEMRGYLNDLLPSDVDRAKAIALLLDGDMSHGRCIRPDELSAVGFRVETDDCELANDLAEECPDGVWTWAAKEARA